MGYPHKSHPRETPILSKHFGDPDARTLSGWRQRGGYRALEQALGTSPADIVNVVKESGLRGRGGAGFPTGMKWSFMKPGDGKPHYLCCNADESEPGTFKDREIMRWTPHALIEGCAIGAHAIGAETAYIYIRGEFTEPIRVMEEAVRDAYRDGILGKNAMGSGKRVDVHVHRGAGAYICGEETALMNSLEGRRGNPRIKPPFPAVAGLFGQPTTINNVETLTAVPHILTNGAAWYKAMSLSSPKSTGSKLFSVCGNIRKPGNYEITMGFPFKEFLYDLCGGPLPGRKFKAIIPGGSSVPIQTVEEAEATLMDYEGFVAQGTMLGSGGVIVFDDSQCMVKQIARLARFYAHESCAQCTQCREGTAWTTRILERIEHGEGTMEDLDTLLEIGDNMTGKTICVLSDSCATPVASGIKKWRNEFEAHIKQKRCPMRTAVAA
ncbi:MAG: NADH-quinone oxidoreductase subunit NuoF [Gemmatimonadaceae bacterium]|nr:NADH-quinone oxidoreductase subunit NuoF [Gemmatimonadaceae bacterium]NUQ93401.1 NADH-quinone oxidoreductase subunit NuoF [Gemmatimonadaceae bacterium]NUR20171.1 NADH-quinone oxidoreductase subunit NuoF [Gemmatimonadaceae bacterium]NUS97656.1 NADH-quinone oxidoreductase subunit NuoF [Gemmatimonadaceae bacterium]